MPEQESNVFFQKKRNSGLICKFIIKERRCKLLYESLSQDIDTLVLWRKQLVPVRHVTRCLLQDKKMLRSKSVEIQSMFILASADRAFWASNRLGFNIKASHATSTRRNVCYHLCSNHFTIFQERKLPKKIFAYDCGRQRTSLLLVLILVDLISDRNIQAKSIEWIYHAPFLSR